MRHAEIYKYEVSISDDSKQEDVEHWLENKIGPRHEKWDYYFAIGALVDTEKDEKTLMKFLPDASYDFSIVAFKDKEDATFFGMIWK